ncbi:MAG: NarK/NasA family nitrate transporter [Chthonomonas sp.]|nr:NarK/NasA family nitrate transporter [Chthonomonas sp.]
MSDRALANRMLILNTVAFTVCFAVWTMYGVLGAFLADKQIIPISKEQLGWLLGVPILTGSIMRLPVGLLTDRYGGKPVYIGVMLLATLGVASVSFATSYAHLVISGLLFGMSGAAFAVGIAYTSVFFPKEKQGTALGIFGVGNAGSALTTLLAPLALQRITQEGSQPEGWRTLPLIYAGCLFGMTILFALLTKNRVTEGANQKTIRTMLAPLKSVRVWRFGAYYFLVFGAFVALAQWLVPYYLNVYGMSLAMAGLMASIFSLPSGLIRALGGWLSDKFGARATMYWVLASCVVLFALVVAPRMDIMSPGEGVLADRAGTVTQVSQDRVQIDDKTYALQAAGGSTLAQTLSSKGSSLSEGTLILPRSQSWQEPVVEVGQKVKKRDLLARGVTHVYFQANVWIFTVIVFLAGIMMGIGKAAVYRHIPDYFPDEVGVVGGIVGVIGGLGGFVCPILFGYLLKSTGLWTSCWLFLAVLSVICLVWMHITILKMAKQAPATE